MRLRLQMETPDEGQERAETARAVSWLIRLWVSDVCSLTGRVVEARTHDVWVRLPWLPSGVLRIGQRYRVEIHPGTAHPLSSWAEVRHVNAEGAALTIDRDLLDPPVA